MARSIQLAPWLLLGMLPGAWAASYPAWQDGGTYKAGQVVSYQGRDYRAWVDQTDYAGAGWNPVAAASLWQDLGADRGTSPTPTPTPKPTSAPTPAPTPKPTAAPAPTPAATPAPTAAGGTPYSGAPVALPTLVQAENFNLGGEGTAYYTYANSNKGGQYRPNEGVSIEATSGGYDVGWTAPGEWFNYTVSSELGGRLVLQTRVASSGVGGTFHYLIDGVSATAQQTVPDTGGWQNFSVISTPVALSAGTHLVQLHMDNAAHWGGIGNFDWFRIGRPLGGANTVPSRISANDQARSMVQQVKNAGAGTLRIQYSHDEIRNSTDLGRLATLLDEGNKQGVTIQFAFRDNDNGGGGNILYGSALDQAATDIKYVLGLYGQNASFLLDTFNEGATNASQDWANMEVALIKAARAAGYKKAIVVEDSNWGGGLTAGSESGLVKFASQLAAANGQGNPAMIGSVHEYANGDDAPGRLTQEINALVGAGYKVQIGEVGNANWTGGSSFEERDGAVNAVKANIPLLRKLDATVLPWMDQFVNGSISHTVGFSAADQLL